MTHWYKKDIGDNLFIAIFLAFMSALIAFWFSYTYPQSMNENMGVLLVFAERIANGGEFGKDIFEVNPPLSTLLYVPIIWLKTYLPLTIHQASFLYTSTFLIFSTALIHRLLCISKTSTYEHVLILSLYIIGHLFITVNDYGEREQFVAMGLTPLCLYIYLKTAGISFSRAFSILVVAFGITMILLKPHFGLAPAILFLHRAWKQKQLFSPIKDIDFIVMSMGTALYAAILCTVYNVYTFEQLPIIMDLYVSQVFIPRHMVLIPLITSVITIIMVALSMSNDKIKRSQYSYLSLISFLAITSLMSFIAQTKGLMYQLIPAVIFFSMAIGLYIFYNARPFMNERRALILSVLTAFLLPICTIYPLNFIFPNQNDIKKLPFAQWFNEYCPKDIQEQCAAYIFHESVDGIFSSFHYTDTQYASRFPAHWFLPIIVNNQLREDAGLSSYKVSFESARSANKMFSQMVADDFQIYRPHFVAIIQTSVRLDLEDAESEETLFDFPTHYSKNTNFKQIWKSYKHVGTRVVNRKNYFNGSSMDQDHLMTYDLYVRR